MPCSKVSPHDKIGLVDQNEKPKLSPYERVMECVHHDPKWADEVTLGRRIGLYRFRSELGSGNFSQVKLAVHQLTREKVAIKIIDRSRVDEVVKRMLDREISIMESIHHQHIIRLYEVIETYNKLYIVMEFAAGDELHNRISCHGCLDEEESRQLFVQITSAVSYMHGKNLIHRDIKAENVFYSSPNKVKLGDFGFSAHLTEGKQQLLTTFCGSPPYAAPELFRDEHYIGGPVDVWALGILLYFMVVGCMPFKGQTIATLKLNIMEGMYPTPRNVSKSCVQLIESMLNQKPKERPTVNEILDCDWLSGIEPVTPPSDAQSYTLMPTILPYGTGVPEYSEVEKTARERLAALGISQALLASQSVQGSRSHVIGCYRIVVHRIQKQIGSFLDLDCFLPQQHGGHGHTNVEEQKKNHHNLLMNFFSRKDGSSESLFFNCWNKVSDSVGNLSDDTHSINTNKTMSPVGNGRLFTQNLHDKNVNRYTKVVKSTTCVIL